jgi:hypothetical protein
VKILLTLLGFVFEKLLSLIMGTIFYIAFGSLMFALFVRGYSFLSGNRPDLNSYDPRLRTAAAVAAGDKYGVKP